MVEQTLTTSSMSIDLIAPNSFCYLDALHTLQRSASDPINHVQNNILTRLIPIGKYKLLVCVAMDKCILTVSIQNQSQKIHCLDELSIHIKHLFGLDDPLVYTALNLKKFSDKYVDHSLGVHGYLSIFEAMIQTIIGQLISSKAANSIREKFIRMFGDSFKYGHCEHFIFPEAINISKLSILQLKQAGVSESKARSILEIAKEFSQNKLKEKLQNAANGYEIKKILLDIYGIGEWTSDWVALRALRKFEVIPYGDLIVRKAFSWLLDLPKLATREEIDSVCKEWPLCGGFIAYRVMYSYIKNHKK